MLALFSNTYQTRGQISLHPQTQNYRELVKRNVLRQKEYYASASRAVFANHPLAQALKLIGANADVEPWELYDRAITRAPYVARTLDFTSDVAKGRLNRYHIYSCANSLNLNIYDYISPFTSTPKWREIKPVNTVWIDSPYVDMAVPPDVKETLSFSAVSVDLPKLVLMYRGFLDDRKRILAEQNGQLLLGEENFVAMYVLPSMLESQVDISAVSATQALYYGNYETQRAVKSAIYLPGYGSEFEKIAKYALDRIDGAKMQYIHMLQHIPAVYRDSAAQTLILPSLAPTTQVNWALLISRLATIMFLIDVGGKAARDTNRGYINDLKRRCKEISLAGIPYSLMSDSLATFVDRSLVRISKL